MATNTISRKRSVRTARTRQSANRRRGCGRPSAAPQRRQVQDDRDDLGGSGRSVILAVLTVFGAAEEKIKECCFPGGAFTQIVFDQATANAQSVPMTGVLGDGCALPPMSTAACA